MNTCLNSPELILQFEVASLPGNELVAINRVAEIVQILEARGRALTQANVERIKTAVAEATMNAMEHGNQYQEDCPVKISALISADQLIIRIVDQGGDQGGDQPSRQSDDTTIPSPALTAEEPDLAKKLAGTQSPRGWGLFLIKNMTDALSTTSDGQEMTVELRFDLE